MGLGPNWYQIETKKYIQCRIQMFFGYTVTCTTSCLGQIWCTQQLHIKMLMDMYRIKSLKAVHFSCFTMVYNGQNMFPYLKINFTQISKEETEPVVERISVKKGIFPFLVAKIWAPILVYRYEILLGRSLIYQKLANFMQKKIAMLAGLKVSSWVCKHVFYRPRHNAKGSQF